VAKLCQKTEEEGKISVHFFNCDDGGNGINLISSKFIRLRAKS
jgi:hypothetical protein